MGHKGEMQPLNPVELFKIMDKMLEINSPFLDKSFVLENFRGIDVESDYVCYINTKSLLSLYSKGEAIVLIIPDRN